MTMRAHFAEEKLIVRCGQKLCLGNIAELVTRIVIYCCFVCLVFSDARFWDASTIYVSTSLYDAALYVWWVIYILGGYKIMGTGKSKGQHTQGD